MKISLPSRIISPKDAKMFAFCLCRLLPTLALSWLRRASGPWRLSNCECREGPLDQEDRRIVLIFPYSSKGSTKLDLPSATAARFKFRASKRHPCLGLACSEQLRRFRCGHARELNLFLAWSGPSASLPNHSLGFSANVEKITGRLFGRKFRSFSPAHVRPSGIRKGKASPSGFISSSPQSAGCGIRNDSQYPINRHLNFEKA